MTDRDGFWWRLVHLEPALIRGAVMAGVTVLVSVGIVVIPGLPDAMVGVWLAISAIVQALWTRRGVTANARVVVRAPNPIGEPALIEPGEAVTMATAAKIVDAARASG